MYLNIEKFILTIIFFSFLAHFGIYLAGQQVYFFYLLEITLIFLLLFSIKLRFDFKPIEIKLISLFLIVAFLSMWMGFYSPILMFKGETIFISSLKALIYLSLNVFIILLLQTYCKSEKFFSLLIKCLKYVIIFYLFYASIEYFHKFIISNEILKTFIQFFHIGDRSINKQLLTLLGHEHSNASILVLILYTFVISCLINGYRLFGHIFVDIFVIALLILLILLLESKIGYIAFILVNIAIFFIILFRSKLNFLRKVTLTIFLFSILIYLYFQFESTILKQLGLATNYDHPSFNIRANFALSSLFLLISYPVLGVGINNFKFFLAEAIQGLQQLPFIDIKVAGNIDGHSELELNAYLFNEVGMPDPFNFILGLGAEVGVIGLSIFLLILTLIFLKSLKTLRNKKLNKLENVIAYFNFLSLVVIIISYAAFYQYYFFIQWIIIGLNISFISYIVKKYN